MKIAMHRLREDFIPTLTANEAEALRELKKKISEVFQNSQLILYGSKARGDFNQDSDIDILVIASEPDDHTHRMKLYGLTFEVNMAFMTDFSCRLRNVDNWLRGDGEYPLFKSSVMEEGIEIEL
jgi:predicted nucleotidyltransferase